MGRTMRRGDSAASTRSVCDSLSNHGNGSFVIEGRLRAAFVVSRRSMRSLTSRMLATTALVLTLVVAAPSRAASLKGWRDGPVADLLTEEEYRQFGTLRNDAARRTFIDGFWRGMEPPGESPSISYRETFEERCRVANERFRTGFQQGSRTDRGRVFLALGEPASVHYESGGPRAVEQEVWTYDSGSGTEPPLRIGFFRCLDGGYRLDPSCAAERDVTSVAYDGERAEFLRRLTDERRSLFGDRG